MVVGLAAVTLSILDRSARWLLALRPLPGIAWLFLLVLPWFIAIYWRVGSQFLVASVGEDMLAKVAGAQETHGAPPGLYVLLFFATFFPASMLAGLAAPAVWAVRREPAARFLLAWLVPSWIVFELVVTKLPHYVLPLYPAIAILIAGAVETRVLSRRLWLVRGVLWWFLVPVIVSVIAVIAAVVIDRELALLAWPFFAGAIVCGLFAWQLYDDDGAERAFMRATVASVLMAIGMYAVVVPSLTPAFPSVALAQVLHMRVARIPSLPAPATKSPAWCFSPAPRPVSPTPTAPPIFCRAAVAALPSSTRRRSANSRCAPRRSGCAMTADRASRATTSASGGRSPSRCSNRQARREWAGSAARRIGSDKRRPLRLAGEARSGDCRTMR